MKLKLYLSKYGVRIAAVILAAALIVGIGAGVRGGRAGFLRNAGEALTDPIGKATAAVLDWMEGIYGYIYDYDRIVEENNALRAENAELREQVRDYEELAAENERLRTLFDWTEKSSSMELEAAKVLSWDASNYTSAFMIGKGSNHGIEIGDCVITEYGALAGQVIELGDDWAKIQTVIDVDMDVGALVGVYSYAGMVSGEYGLMRQGQTRLAYLTSGAQIFEGDEVLTSGTGGSFPPGLMIGTVSAVMTEAGGQVTYGVVEPACDVSRLTQIFIVKSFEVIE